MKNALPIALAALLLSLLALGATLLGQEPVEVRETDLAPVADPALATRLADLTDENAALERRIADLELALSGLEQRAPERTAVGGKALGDDALEQVVAEVREAFGADAGASPKLEDLMDDPEFVELFTEKLDELRTRDAGRKRTTSVERRRERLAEAMPGAIEALGLTSDQELGLQDLLTDHYDSQAAMQALWAETGDAQAAGAAKVSSWTTLQDGLTTLLTPEQLEAYGELDGTTFPGGGGSGK